MNQYNFNGNINQSQINTGDNSNNEQVNNIGSLEINYYLDILREDLRQSGKIEYLKEVDILKDAIEKKNFTKTKEILKSLSTVITSAASLTTIAEKLGLLPL